MGLALDCLRGVAELFAGRESLNLGLAALQEGGSVQQMRSGSDQNSYARRRSLVWFVNKFQ